jgi:exo-beta-1,3-glucanase (GH17 family)
LHKFSNYDKERRLQFAAWAQEENETLLSTWLSYETHFYFDGTVNKQNVQVWTTEHLQNLHEKSSHGRKVTVWVAMSSHGLIGPVFCNKTVNSE